MTTLRPHIIAFLVAHGWIYDAAAGLWLVPAGERHACDAEAWRWAARARKVEGGTANERT